MSDQHTPPKRRRRKVTLTEQPVVLNDKPQDVEADGGVRMTNAAVNFITQDPIMESRRFKLDSQEMILIIGKEMLRRGVPAELLNRTQWLWVGTKSGAPELYLIRPGLEA